MIYAIKLLVAVCLVGALAAFLLRRSFDALLTREQYVRAWTVLFVATCAAFLSHFVELYFVFLFFIALWGSKLLGGGDKGKIAVTFLLVVSLPPLTINFGGIGGINNLIQVSTLRVVSLALLVGIAAKHLTSRSRPELGRFRLVDLAVFSYAALRIGLSFPHSTLTTLARLTVESTLDVLVPYYAVSRAIQSRQDLRFCLSHMALGMAFGSIIAVVEALTKHNFYQGLQWIYGVRWQLTQDLLRAGHLRAQAMTPEPIALAFTMIIALGLWIFLNRGAWRARPVLLIFGFTIAALFFTWSRGPWLGALCFGACLLALRRVSPAIFLVGLTGLVIAGVVVKAMDADTLVSSTVSNLFGGSQADLGSIDYRHQLLDTSLALIKQSPWFGVPNYAQSLQALRQGEGIIDLVNSYVAITLDAGVVGLALYLLPFLLILLSLLRVAQQQRSDANAENDNFPRVFAALIVSCLLTIFTTSTIFTMQFLLTMLLALSVAWIGSNAREALAAQVKPDPLRRTLRFQA